MLPKVKRLIFASCFLVFPVFAQAAESCLNFDAVGQEYPIVRDRLIAEGWSPKFLSPPFEGAPFAEWVKARNYAEVEFCAPTGRANCKFTFTSGSNTSATLSILTEGEQLGVVTGHQCEGNPVASGISFEATELGEGIVFHEMDLESCAFEKGLAVASYHARKTNAPTQVQLTHVCVDRANGRLWASEEEHRATLVESNNIEDRFEVLIDGLAPYQRTRINLGKYDHDGEIETQTTSVFYQRPSTQQDGWAHTGTQLDGDVRLGGFAFRGDPVQSFDGAAFSISVTGSDHWEYRRCQFDCSRRSPYMYYEGEVFVAGDDSSSTTPLSLGHDDGGIGDGELTISISDAGVVSGSGWLRQENSTLAGLVDEDWKTTDWYIHSIVGYVLGEGGREIQGIGFASGETIDQDGYRNEVYASVYISGLSADTIERLGEPERADALRRLRGADLPKVELEIEQLLVELGFDAGVVDGELDEVAKAAILAFQTQYSLPPTFPVPDQHITLMRALLAAR